MWGGSGGGPHVLACAALLPDLVTAVAVLASVTPYPADGLDWFHGVGEANGAGFRRVVTDPDAALTALEKARTELLAASPDSLAEHLKSELGSAEATALAEYITFAQQEGLAPDVEGWWEDNLAFMTMGI